MNADVVTLAGLSADTERGWGGPVAILVAGLIGYGLYWLWARFMIDNPSPTSEGSPLSDDEQQVSGVYEHDPLPLPRGDVDHEDRELDQWLIDNRGCQWRDLVTAGAREFDVPRKHVASRIEALGLYL